MLEEIKSNSIDEIKSKINSIYKTFPLSYLEDIINSSNENEVKEKIEELQKLIQKDVK